MLPLSIRDVPPHPDAERLTGRRQDGLQNGFHTGGAWLWEGEVYQPLDGRPYANADYHTPLPDVERCLTLMAGNPLFPKNWRVEELNSRRFLVRKQAYVVSDPHKLTKANLLKVEAGIRELNRNNWEVGDEIQLAFDRDLMELFITDLSACHPQQGGAAFAADEEWRVMRLFKSAGYEPLAKLREHGRHALYSIFFMEDKFGIDVRDYNFIYASLKRPLSRVWATLPDTAYVAYNWEPPSWQTMQPHTWILSPEPLPAEKVYDYKLSLAWERWRLNS